MKTFFNLHQKCPKMICFKATSLLENLHSVVFFFCVFQHLSNLPCTSVYCEYDQICKHANIQSVLGYSDKPFISAVKTIIDRSLYMMFTPSHATQPLGAC